MYCTHCGNELKKEEKFCSQCGKKIEQREESDRESPGAPKVDILPSEDGEALEAQRKGIESDNKHYGRADVGKAGKDSSEGIIKKLLFSKKIEKVATLRKREPLDDGLRKYNYWYILLGLILFCTGKDISAIIMGILIGWVIKTLIAGFRWEYLKTVKYCVRQQIPPDELLKGLVPVVAPYGMLVENKNNVIQIIKGGMKYKVYYEGDSFFKMIPRSFGIQEVLQIGIISKYRRAVTDMGMIGYYITEICSGQEISMTDTEVALAKNQYAVERRKGNLATITGIVVGVAVVIILAFEMGIFDHFAPDYSKEIKGGMFENTTCTIGDAFDDFFSDLTWETNASEVKGLYLVDATGECYYMVEGQLSPTTCTVEFVYNKDTGYFYIQSIAIQDKIYTDVNSISAFIEDMYGLENIVLPNDLEGMFGLLGDAFAEGVNDYLFGSYVSFKEGEDLLSESKESQETEVTEETEPQAGEQEENYDKSDYKPKKLKEYETEAMEYGVDPYNPYEDSVLLWKSLYEPLDITDLMGLSPSELRIARNEIYAAYGREFTSEDLQDYFGSKSWYSGGIPADSFSESVLTEVQKNNIALIIEYENSKK